MIKNVNTIIYLFTSRFHILQSTSTVESGENSNRTCKAEVGVPICTYTATPAEGNLYDPQVFRSFFGNLKHQLNPFYVSNSTSRTWHEKSQGAASASSDSSNSCTAADRKKEGKKIMV